MGIEFREASLVLNTKNQYKLKKGKLACKRLDLFLLMTRVVSVLASDPEIVWGLK